jgi:hypothetical protein
MNTWTTDKILNLTDTNLQQFSALVSLRSLIEQARSNAPSNPSRQTFLQSFRALSQRFVAHVADLRAFAAELNAAKETNTATDPTTLAQFHQRFDTLRLQGHQLITENDAQVEGDKKLFPNGF